jgi:hypothetical protein
MEKAIKTGVGIPAGKGKHIHKISPAKTKALAKRCK